MASNAPVVITASPLNLSITAANRQANVHVAQPQTISLTIAQGGSAGLGSGSGVTYLTDAEPTGAVKELWFNDLTNALKVHDGTEWQGITPDGGYF
jgi:hypothetical protein